VPKLYISRDPLTLTFRYPMVYLVCITPQSFGRWFSFSGYDVPYQFTLFARTLFSLSGVFNAILFFNTRYHLLNGNSSTDKIDTVTPHQPHLTPSPSLGTPEHEDESFPLNEYRGPAPFPVDRETSGESSTAWELRTSARRVSRTDDGEMDYGLAPP
jgi:hypothetical protein